MILIWGLIEDDTTRSVYERLVRRGAPAFALNHARVDDTDLRLTTAPVPVYDLTYEGTPLRLDEVTAAYLRPFDFRDYSERPAHETDDRTVSHGDLVHHLMSCWADHAPGVIINRPAAEATNQSTLLQAGLIRSSGFRTPASLVTNDRDRAAAFRATHRHVIYKSMSSVRRVVKALEDADLLADRGPLGLVLFQQRIFGRQVRVHVVADRTFACLVTSEATDYRYGPASLSAFDLPDRVAARTVSLCRTLGLVLAGIDFILTPDGDWYCLEVDPNPAFAYYDIGPGRIADAVADVLAGSLAVPPALTAPRPASDRT